MYVLIEGPQKYVNRQYARTLSKRGYKVHEFGSSCVVTWRHGQITGERAEQLHRVYKASYRILWWSLCCFRVEVYAHDWFTDTYIQVSAKRYWGAPRCSSLRSAAVGRNWTPSL